MEMIKEHWDMLLLAAAAIAGWTRSETKQKEIQDQVSKLEVNYDSLRDTVIEQRESSIRREEKEDMILSNLTTMTDNINILLDRTARIEEREKK